MHLPTRWSLLLLLSVAQLMVILDISAVNVALPEMAQDLGIGRADIGWAITSYSLVFGSLLLLGGRAADLLGRRRVFLAGLTVFTASSLVTALAGDATMLFAARAGQGLGAAMLSPAALSIITTSFHGPERAKALGVWGAVGGAGAAVGVLLGGTLTELIDWRAIFFINLPVGLALAVGAMRIVPADSKRPQWRGLDLRGALLATASLGGLVYALSQAQTAGWTSTQTLGIGAAGDRWPRPVRRAGAPHRSASAPGAAAHGPRHRRRVPDDADRLGRALRVLPAVLDVPAERAGHGRTRDGARVPSARLGDRARRPRGQSPHHPRGRAPAARRRLRDHDRRDAAAVPRQRATAATRATCCRAC